MYKNLQANCLDSFKSLLLIIQVLFGTFFLQAQSNNSADSLFHVWLSKGVPQGREKEFEEYKMHRKNILANRIGNEKENFSTSTVLDPCGNPGFEQANFTQWGRYSGSTNSGGGMVPVASYGSVDYSSTGNMAYNASLGSSNRFVIHSMPGGSSNTSGVGYDENSGSGGTYYIPVVNPLNGGQYSARLNNNTSGSKSAKMEYYFTVSPLNPTFEFNYAVVLNDGGHQNGDQAAFTYNFYDYNTGALLPVAGNSYVINANTAQNDPAFTLSSSSQFGDDVYFKQWTHVDFDMCSFVGMNVKVKFEALDCAFGGHFCYAYVDLGCGARSLVSQSGDCMDSLNFTLSVSGGLVSYQWINPQGVNITPAQTGTQSTLNLYQYLLNCPGGNCSVNDGDIFIAQVVTTAGCTLNIPVEVDVSEVEIASLSLIPSCAEASNAGVSATASGGMGPGTYNYFWYGDSCTGTILSNGPSLNNVLPLSYCLHVTSGNCPPADTVVSLPVLPMDVLQQTHYLHCLDSAYMLQVDSNGTDFQWYINQMASSPDTNYNFFIQANDYSIPYHATYIHPLDGCKDSINFHLDFSGTNSFLSAEFCPNDSIALLFFNATNGSDQFQWMLDTTLIAGATNDTLGWVAASSLQQYSLYYSVAGCKKAAIQPQQIFPLAIFIPDTTANIFTPNGDGKNDLYSPYVNQQYSLIEIEAETHAYELVIYNRWGNEVFRTENPLVFWNGNNFLGLPESEGTYYWMARFQSNCNNGEPVLQKGFLQLSR